MSFSSQTASDTALAPFLTALDATTNSASSIHALVSKILSTPVIFNGYDQVKLMLASSLMSSNNDSSTILNKIHRTLDLFSYGMYTEYAEQEANYLTLNEGQLLKLRQLTCLTIMQNHLRNFSVGSSSTTCQVPLVTIQKALGNIEMDQVESVIVSCRYAKVLSGKICQRSQSFHLCYSNSSSNSNNNNSSASENNMLVLSRDIPMAQIDNLTLQWQGLSARLSNNINVKLQECKDVVSQGLSNASEAVMSQQAVAGSEAKSNNDTNHRQKRSRGDIIEGVPAAARMQT